MQQINSSPMFDRVMTWSLGHALSTPARYALATLLVGLAAMPAMVVTALVSWLLFVPVVLVVGLLMGRRTGLYAVALSAVLASLSIGASGARFWLTLPQWLAIAIFLLVSSGVVLLAAEVRAAFRRARLLVADRERAHALLSEQDQQRELLNHELGHRIKNLLSVVQAIAGQTLRQSPDLKAASDALGARLAALGKTTHALTASSWHAADLCALAGDALGIHDGNSGRITLEGPPIRFNPRIALALTLTFHELVTNATKYGALSNDTGHVDLKWSIELGANLDQRRFKLTWRERGGPLVEPPTRRGFGSLMIERSLRSYFRGETSIDYRPEGLVFTIDAPLPGWTMEGDREWRAS